MFDGLVRAARINYLTGATGAYLESGIATERGIGLLIQPGNHYHLRVQHYPAWAADNGAFSKKHGFNPVKFRAMLAQPNLRANVTTCLFVAAPDVLRVLDDGTVIGDARATLDQFPTWAREIRELGYPVALVAQNGLEDMLHLVPWDLVDVLFLGGSTEWKLGAGARACVEFARALGKGTHMGRVNSYKRLALAQGWGVDTADGTFLAYGPTQNLPRLLAWLDKLDALTPPPAAQENAPVTEAQLCVTGARPAVSSMSGCRPIIGAGDDLVNQTGRLHHRLGRPLARGHESGRVDRVASGRYPHHRHVMPAREHQYLGP